MSAINLTNCDEQTALNMSKALFDHAREVNRYARTYPAVFASLKNKDKARESIKSFIKNVTRMIKEMTALMLMARYKGVSRFCNTEQIEAIMEETQQIVDQLEAQRRQEESVIETPHAFYN